MIDFRNPYTPGAGVTPSYLAGRDDLLGSALNAVRAVSEGYFARSIVYYGLRGVGKTVLLNAIEDEIKDLNVIYRHIEVNEESNFVAALTSACSDFTRQLSLKENVKTRMNQLVSIMRGFSVTWSPEDNSFTLARSESQQSSPSTTSRDLSVDFTEVLTLLGTCAKQSSTTLCFFIDEIQYAKKNELEALITAVHRVGQLKLPILFFLAGLPKILQAMGEAKSYTERLFEFVKIDSLGDSAARSAIIIPAQRLGVEYDERAILRILEHTKGYPYFIQQICETIWVNGDSSTRVITEALVDAHSDAAIERLDAGFFQVRYDRCTAMERKFMFAMAECGGLPCTIEQVANNMGKAVKSIGPHRGNLINKGLIYATSHGMIDFTVPQFDAFLNRKSKA